MGNLSSTCTKGQGYDARRGAENAEKETDSLADDEARTWADFLEAAGVPEDAINEGFAGRIMGSEENLDAVGGPFGFGWQEVRNADRDAALGANFVEEKFGGETCFRIFEGCGKRLKQRTGD